MAVRLRVALAAVDCGLCDFIAGLASAELSEKPARQRSLGNWALSRSARRMLPKRGGAPVGVYLQNPYIQSQEGLPQPPLSGSPSPGKRFAAHRGRWRITAHAGCHERLRRDRPALLLAGSRESVKSMASSAECVGASPFCSRCLATIASRRYVAASEFVRRQELPTITYLSASLICSSGSSAAPLLKQDVFDSTGRQDLTKSVQTCPS